MRISYLKWTILNYIIVKITLTHAVYYGYLTKKYLILKENGFYTSAVCHVEIIYIVLLLFIINVLVLLLFWY